MARQVPFILYARFTSWYFCQSTQVRFLNEQFYLYIAFLPSTFLYILITNPKFRLYRYFLHGPGRVAQSLALLIHSGARGPRFDIRSGHILSFLLPPVVSNWRMYLHEVLANRLGSQSLPTKCVTDRPDMTSAVYRGRKTTKQYSATRTIHIYHLTPAGRGMMA